jgi:chromosome segregation ATPase
VTTHRFTVTSRGASTIYGADIAPEYRDNPAIAAAERRLSTLGDDLALAVWNRDKLVRSRSAKPDIAAAAERVADLTAEVDALQLLVAELRSSVVQGQLATLESEAVELRKVVDESYAGLKEVLGAMGRYESTADTQRRKLRDRKNGVMARWRNGADLEAEARRAVSDAEQFEKKTEEEWCGLVARRREAEADWNSRVSQLRQSTRRLDEFRHDPNVIAVLRSVKPSLDALPHRGAHALSR